MFVALFVLWIVLALAVVALAVYRRMIAQQEDDALHVLEPVSVAQQQVGVAQKLDEIDRWGKRLTILTTVYGLILAVAFVLQAWFRGPNIGV